MSNIKHVGRLKSNGRKVLVAYRTLPGESDSALVVTTENLTPEQHDTLLKLVESNAAQTAYEFAEVMARAKFPDGSTILAYLHVNGKLSKVKTSEVTMLPGDNTSIPLDELNQLIAQQKGISVNDLALGSNPNNQVEVQEVATAKEMPAAPATNDEPLSDEDLAKSLRSQADAMFKEAQRLRKEAEDLVPTKKKTTKKTETA
jgi:hypothetical protein